MTDLRAEFESLASQYGYDLTWAEIIDSYAALNVRCLFDAWQASRVALKVQLPATCNRALIIEHDLPMQDEIMHDEYFEVDDIKQMLTNAGISYE